MFLHNCLDIKGLEKAPQHLLKATIHPQAHTNSNVVSGILGRKFQSGKSQMSTVKNEKLSRLLLGFLLPPSSEENLHALYCYISFALNFTCTTSTSFYLSLTSTTIYTIVEIFVLSLLEKMYFLLLAKNRDSISNIVWRQQTMECFFTKKNAYWSVSLWAKWKMS